MEILGAERLYKDISFNFHDPATSQYAQAGFRQYGTPPDDGQTGAVERGSRIHHLPFGYVNNTGVPSTEAQRLYDFNQPNADPSHTLPTHQYPQSATHPQHQFAVPHGVLHQPLLHHYLTAVVRHAHLSNTNINCSSVNLVRQARQVGQQADDSLVTRPLASVGNAQARASDEQAIQQNVSRVSSSIPTAQNDQGTTRNLTTIELLTSSDTAPNYSDVGSMSGFNAVPHATMLQNTSHGLRSATDGSSQQISLALPPGTTVSDYFQPHGFPKLSATSDDARAHGYLPILLAFPDENVTYVKASGSERRIRSMKALTHAKYFGLQNPSKKDVLTNRNIARRDEWQRGMQNRSSMCGRTSMPT